MEKVQNFVNKNKWIVAIASILIIAVFAIVFIGGEDKNITNLNKFVNNTTIAKAESYKMDLRIFGKYNDKGINNIIMVSNYKDTDKEINITSGEKSEKYLVKEGKKYSVKDEKLTEVDKVPFENTENFLLGVRDMFDVKQSADGEISGVKYKVYTGNISSEDMNKIIKSAELDFEVNKNASVEVWLTQDNYVYKIYYRVDDLTIYPSYFGYGLMNKVNLDMYKA